MMATISVSGEYYCVYLGPTRALLIILRRGATISVSGEYYYIYLGPTSVLQIILRGGWGQPSVFKVSIITYTRVLPVHC